VYHPSDRRTESETYTGRIRLH